MNINLNFSNLQSAEGMRVCACAYGIDAWATVHCPYCSLRMPQLSKMSLTIFVESRFCVLSSILAIAGK